LDSGTDRLLEWLPPEGAEYLNSSPTSGFDPFIGIGGSKLEIDTGNGTKLKTKNGGINFGMTRYLKNRHGMLIVAPLVDYGQDSYESTLNDANHTQGSGNSKYFMAGLIARQVSVNGMYYEASIRGGKLKTNFHSDNFLVNNVPTSASYEASTPCYAGHLRVGWRNHISPKNILDVYGMYSLNHVKGFTTKVSTNEDYSFSSVNSGRIRIGARLTRELKERESIYSSISYIHEFTGETTGEYMGMSTQKTGLKGSAGLIELGWQVKPAKNSVAMIDTSISCWVGDRKGFIFATKFKKDF
jgi:outer membrane autotransporter protein